jgi:hypothetical protein
MITQEFLKEHLEYRDGHLWWIKTTGKRVKVGQQFGTYHKRGYRHGKLKGKRYLEHRLVWLYHCGCWPKECIDHINGIPGDNRIENLRECTVQQNSFNRKSERDSSSEYKGVSWHKQCKKWQVRYHYKGKSYYLGLYETEIEAAEAYRKVTEHLHKEYANYG